jgi:DNA repair exonuclease SbcCD nuclease subunit
VVRFLHTADWHLGAPFPGRERADELRKARLKTVTRVLEIAATLEVDFVLVAGDIFESNSVAASLLYSLKNTLAAAPCPVYIIPGNHDPLSQDSIYGVRDEWRELPPKVVVMKSQEALAAPGATIYPCPCVSKYATLDPTSWIPPRKEGEIRIGVAHGSWQVNPELLKDDYPIALSAAEDRDLDYLALGHWHSTMPGPEKQGRVHYSGTPETLSYGEENSGNVLLVEIEGPGARPAVRAERAGTYRWLTSAVALHDDASIAALRTRLMSIEAPATTLLRLLISGVASAGVHDSLASLQAEMKSRFFDISVDTVNLHLLMDAGEASELPTALLTSAALRLIGISTGAEAPPAASLLSKARAIPGESPKSELALQLLFTASRHAGEEKR